jgi:predicted heme/steroid binding protein
MTINQNNQKENKTPKKPNWKWLIYLLLLFLIPTITFLFGYWQRINTAKSNDQVINNTDNLPFMKESDLSEFNGTDPNKPIYIGLNGYVYDVSPGRDFYNPDGPYHYLAGRDSSTELNLIGGDIIARKYKIIAKLSE